MSDIYSKEVDRQIASEEKAFFSRQDDETNEGKRVNDDDIENIQSSLARRVVGNKEEEDIHIKVINSSRDTFQPTITNEEIEKQFGSIQKSDIQANQGSHRSQQSNHGGEPNDIDDDLIFSQNTYETGDQARPGEIDKFDSLINHTRSKDEGSVNNKFEDSLERNDTLMFQNNQNKQKEQTNTIQNAENKANPGIINVENQHTEHTSNDKHLSEREKMLKDPITIGILTGNDDHIKNKDNDKQNKDNTKEKNIEQYKDDKIIIEKLTGKDEDNNLVDKEEVLNERVNKNIKIQKQEQMHNQKQITFQSDNFVDEQQLHQNQQSKQILSTNQDIITEPNHINLHVVHEESKDDISQSLKGSIIPPQKNMLLNPKDYQDEDTKKPFDYKQLEGFLKNQKRNLVYPNNQSEEELNTKGIDIRQQEMENGDQSPLMNKGNASRAAGLSLNSDNFKFTVKPIVNSSQFFNQESKQNIPYSSQNEIDNQTSNRNNNMRHQQISSSGMRQNGIQSLQQSEVYQSNFYQEGGQSMNQGVNRRNQSEQTFMSISSSQPSQFVNKFGSNKNNELMSQEELQSQKAKRFTNLRESVNDEQDIPEDLSTYSKNTVQRYMVDQLNLVGSSKDKKRDSTASMLTVESKDTEGPTQDQVRKMVVEQVEHMIRSKLNGQSAQKQNNMMMNNEVLFRQVIREELQNFLKGNTLTPSSMPQLSSPQQSQLRVNKERQRFQKFQNERLPPTENKQQSVQFQKEQGGGGNSKQPYINNEEIDYIIDESIQKHQHAQIQNNILIQNEQIEHFQMDKQPNMQQMNNAQRKSDQIQQDYQSKASSSVVNIYTDRRQEQPLRIMNADRTTNQNSPRGDYPISITDQVKNNSHVYNQLIRVDVENNFSQQNAPNTSYKDQYKQFKNALTKNDNTFNQNHNFDQNHSIHQRQQSGKTNQHQTSYLSSENSPRFAKDGYSQKLGDISFSINRQQSHGNNPYTNDSLQPNKNMAQQQHHHNYNNNLNSRNSPQLSNNYSQQNRTTEQGIQKQSDHSQGLGILPQISRQQQDYTYNAQLSQHQQDTQRETPNYNNYINNGMGLHSTSSQSPSPTQFIQNDQKMNYQDMITNPPQKKYNIMLQQQQNVNEYDYQDNQNVQNNQHLLESSIYQRNSDQHHSLESIQHSIFPNRSSNAISQPFQQKSSSQLQHLQSSHNQSISQLWDKALDFYQRGQLSRAYQMLLDIEDDIYLIRMMSITGPCFAKLNQNVGKKLLRRINKITSSQFMDSMSLQMIQKSYEQDLLEDLNLEDNQNIKEILYDISASLNIGEQAAKLYNLIDHAEHV